MLFTTYKLPSAVLSAVLSKFTFRYNLYSFPSFNIAKGFAILYPVHFFNTNARTLMLSLPSMTPPGEISSSGGPEMDVDTRMSVVQENDDQASDHTERPVKKMRFDQALDILAESSVSDHNANLAPCLEDQQNEEQDNTLRSPIHDNSKSTQDIETDADKGDAGEAGTGASDNTEYYYIEGDLDSLSPEQNELLHSAVDSYIYLPKTTLQKVYKEFNAGKEKGSPTIYWSKVSLKSWFEVASNSYDHIKRFEMITDKLENQNNNISEEERSLVRPKENRSLKFRDKVSVRKFFTGAPATFSHVLELEEVDLVCEEKQDWTQDQLEILETAIEAYKYFPKAVVKKVHKELRCIVESREVRICSKLQISNWLKAALASEEEVGSVRWKVQDRLEEMRSLDPEDEEPRISPVKVNFTDNVEVNIFEVNSPASRMLGDMNGEIEM